VQIRSAELVLNFAQHATEVASLQAQIDELRAELGLDDNNGRTPLRIAK
jgi:hypothetical protein